MSFQHTSLAAGLWQNLSLAEQLGNIGSEVSRASKWRNKDQKLFHGAVDRALELFDLTVADSRWRHRLKEILRARELLQDAVEGGKSYGSTLEDLERYFFLLALASRIAK